MRRPSEQRKMQIKPYISFGVGYCFIHAKAMREALLPDEAISSHTFSIENALSGNLKALFCDMTIIAIILYVVGAVFAGPLWPLELLMGQGGCLGQIIAGAWALLFLGGIG